MLHSHGVDNCSLRIFRNGQQFDHADSKSPTLNHCQNMLPTSYWLWAYLYTVSLGLLVIMAKAMLLLVVTIIPAEVRLVGRVFQHQHLAIQI